VTFPTLWGTNVVRHRPSVQAGWVIPNVDGYKTAFLHPPHGLSGSDQKQEEVFDGINAFILGADPTRCEIFSWATDWSNYFDAGNEWWGAFHWIVRAA
jgi:hypothetical protein